MKRITSALLCLCLLLCVLGSAASAAELRQFSDSDLLGNREENTVLVQLGIISGMPDGSFQPGRTLTRAEAAVILARLAGFEAKEASCACMDVYPGHWAESAIAYCLDRGLLSADQGLFHPEISILFRDLCSALLQIIGYPAESGEALEARVKSCGLTAEGDDLNAFVSRDAACKVIYNAVCCSEIAEWKDGSPVYFLDDLMNPVTLLEHRYGVVKYSEVVVANEFADLTGETARLEPGLTKLAEHRAFAVSTDFGFLGHKVDIYVRDGEVIGTPQLSNQESYAVFASGRELLEFVDNNEEFSLAEDASIFLNAQKTDISCLLADYDFCRVTAFDHDLDGSFDLVLVMAYREVKVVNAASVRLVFTDGTETLLEKYSGVIPDNGTTAYAAEIAGIWHFFLK